ncbi:peptidoglycan-binding domain-containing protein [Paenarthrobacter nitroguajacolicus]|uniref:peptidoglycan-binding domain-containing protein n=1 Tax=Paenarthrobacter nitroguajacolicus TaxID=211146 RepID=UPI002864F1F5|nr:peptidoglycan-binding domain-containing protein [Paenarthrobacter nitroguajacolicus]MDR6636716.1 peptidoglycan hydrolase-like protein with peptidoglycan-binding domain [Paenarthrobacter nitroguajacolicus]
MKRVPRWWLVVVAGVVALSGMFAAYWAGSQAASMATSTQDTPEVIPVSATIERRAVAQQVTVAGKVVAGKTSPVTASLSDGIDRLVLTSTPKAVGDSVAPGELLAVVSGRPLLVMPANVPMYRDLVAGDSGPDVRALQESLAGFGFAVKATGIFDQQTQDALEAWYKAAGFSAPTSSNVDASNKSAPAVMFRWRDFVQVPGDTGRVASIAATGAVLAEDGVVAQISIAEDTIVARATVLQAGSFAVGSSVTVRAGTVSVNTLVTAAGAFTEGDSGNNVVPGMDITFSIPSGTVGLAPGQSVTATSGSVPAQSLAVPLIAIRQESGIAYVQLGTEEGSKRIDVTVTAQAEGWAALADVQGIAVGDKVLLP